MTTPDRTLGVAVCGTGWCAAQHISAFQKNPRARVTWICGRDVERARAALSKAGVALAGVRLTSDYGELLAARDVDIISIATPNHLHADEAVGAARAGKHFVLEKPTGLDVPELVRVRDAVRKTGVRTIVSFELRYNPFLKFARWLQAEGWLGRIRFARTQYLSQRHRLVQRLGVGPHEEQAGAVISSPPVATPWTPCASAPASSRRPSARSTRTSRAATSGRPRSWRT